MRQLDRRCPVCNNIVRTVGSIRKNKYGEKHGYIYCKSCDKKMHVYIDDNDQVFEYPRYNHVPGWTRNYAVMKGNSLQAHVQSVVDGTYEEPKQPIKLNLKQKPKENDDPIIIECPQMDQEEAMENIRRFFNL